MFLLSVRLPPEIETRLNAEVEKRGLKKSEIVRQALEAHLATHDPDYSWNTLRDDWGDFGGLVIQAQQEVFGKIVEKLYADRWKEMASAMERAFNDVISEMYEEDGAAWDALVAPLYKLFRQKVIEKTKAAHNGGVYGGAGAGPPYIISVTYFAADDNFARKKTLEDLFYEYCVDVGDEAFNEIPNIWAKAKDRLNAKYPNDPL